MARTSLPCAALENFLQVELEPDFGMATQSSVRRAADALKEAEKPSWS